MAQALVGKGGRTELSGVLSASPKYDWAHFAGVVVAPRLGSGLWSGDIYLPGRTGRGLLDLWARPRGCKDDALPRGAAQARAV
eukprot:scaffold567_cov384-Prasinococcus_capsulatus_cf.AAC.17